MVTWCRLGKLSRSWPVTLHQLAWEQNITWHTWHVDFQCYRCAHCGDSHQHAAQLTLFMSARIYKQHSHRRLYLYFHRTCNLKSWLPCLDRMDSWTIFTLSSNTQDWLCVSFAERTFILKLLMPLINGLPSRCSNSTMGSTSNVYFTVCSHKTAKVCWVVWLY
jgi:hypothetical protein